MCCSEAPSDGLVIFRNMLGATRFALLSRLQRLYCSTSENFSFLEDAKHYFHMRTKLEAGCRQSMGALDKACLHILSLQPPLKVNSLVLGLDALALDSYKSLKPKYSEIREAKKSNSIKVGKFTAEDGELVEELFVLLAKQAGVEEETLKAELFSRKQDKEFMLKRQLVGFFLLHDLEDRDMRLPVEVVNQLWAMHISGTFSKEDDAVIEAWVVRNGPVKWPELARSLERSYPGAAESVRLRHQVLRAKKLGETTKSSQENTLSSEDVRTVIKQVLKQNPKAVEEARAGSVDWEKISTLLDKPWMTVYNTWRYNIHPTLRRHLAGTLEVDVRPALIQKVREGGWTYSKEVEFFWLASLEEFRGHTSSSLDLLYQGMLQAAAKKEGIRTGSQVTIGQVEKWWNSSKMGGKTEPKRAREQQIIESYLSVLQELKMSAQLKKNS